ncbi:Major facilitator superfamily protein [Spironucleus salmonicida]|uniref:Major facilitator superfamily protein n=1 Tax=Spironucleus salmonicida TaxID=348837 RepID=V6LU73_9EUKA|nr:Major facilitator superfamily protein [Spironucleus salmonicida]|eukprot:EST44354.1 Major facilitator superfamily protein [Spironucleus salmonicida]
MTAKHNVLPFSPQEQEEIVQIDHQIEDIQQNRNPHPIIQIASDGLPEDHNAEIPPDTSPQAGRRRPWHWDKNSPGTSTFWAICPYIFFVCSINQFDESVLPLALPLIQHELNISYAQAQWLGTSYYLGTAATAIPLSRLTQLTGVVTLTRILLVVALALYVLAFFVTDFVYLVVIRAFIGGATSGFVSTRNMFVSSYPSDANRRQSVANTLTLRMAQQVICPIVGQFVIDAFGWRYVHLCPVVLIALALVLLVPFSEAKRSGKWLEYDYLGAFLLGCVLIASTLSFTFISFQDFLAAGILFAVFVASCVLFYFLEKRVKQPILPLGLLRNPLSDVLITNTLNFTNTLSLQNLIPQILTFVAFPEPLIGIISASGSAFGVISTFINNYMSRSIVTRHLMPIVQLVLLVQMAVFAGVFQHKYGALVMFFAYIFFSVWVQQHTFGLLLTCAPRSLSQYVCGFPALSRTFGSSLAGSLNQSIFAIVGAIIPNDDSKKFIVSVISVVVFQMVLVVLTVLISFMRFGNHEDEAHKKGYQKHKVRNLKFIEESHHSASEV